MVHYRLEQEEQERLEREEQERLEQEERERLAAESLRAEKETVRRQVFMVAAVVVLLTVPAAWLIWKRRAS